MPMPTTIISGYPACWFADVLPDLNQDDPLVEQCLIQNAVWWIESAGLNGLRIDTFPYVPRSFWHDYNQFLHALYPKLRDVGEIFNGDAHVTSFFAGGRANAGSDGTYDTLLDTRHERDFCLKRSRETIAKNEVVPLPLETSSKVIKDLEFDPFPVLAISHRDAFRLLYGLKHTKAFFDKFVDPSRSKRILDLEPILTHLGKKASKGYAVYEFGSRFQMKAELTDVEELKSQLDDLPPLAHWYTDLRSARIRALHSAEAEALRDMTKALPRKLTTRPKRITTTPKA